MAHGFSRHARRPLLHGGGLFTDLGLLACTQSMLVCAYSNARALKQKSAGKRKMDNELYFYGQVPDRDAAEEAGRIMQSESQVQALTGVQAGDGELR